MREVNPETIPEALSWYKILPLNGFDLTREVLSWYHRTSTPHRSETKGIAERAVRRVKKVRQQFCRSQDWMKGGGQTLWNVVGFCEMSKTS